MKKHCIYISIYRSTFFYSNFVTSHIQFSMYIDDQFYLIDRDTWKLLRKRGIKAKFYYRVIYFPGTKLDSIEDTYFNDKKLIIA